MTRPLRISLIALASVIGLAVAVGGVLIASFDPNSLKPRIIEAVRRATGRDLVIAGDIRLAPSLWPTIMLSDVRLSNPPGFSRAQMATLQGLNLEVSLLPLLTKQIEIDRLVLIRPDILLEKDAAGRPNWQMTPQAEPSTPSETAAAPSTPRAPVTIGVQEVRIQDGTLGYRDDRSGGAWSFGVPALVATAASRNSPLHVDTNGTFNGLSFNAVADTGSLTRLQDRNSIVPWPLKLAVTANGMRLTADGSVTHPLQAQGYALSLDGTVPDLADLAPLLPGVTMPPIHDVAIAAAVSDADDGRPAVRSGRLHIGAATFGLLVLTKLDIDVAALDQPAKAVLAGTLNGTPLSATATLGALGSQPIPIDATVQTAAGAAAIRAKLAPASNGAAGGFRDGVALQGLTVSSADADVTGDAILTLAPRRSLTATLTANRIDLDAIQAAFEKVAAPAQPPAAPVAPATPAPEAKPERRRSDRIFSDQPLPFDRLRAAEADLRLAIGTLRAGGQDYRKIDTHIVLSDRKLLVDPLSAELPQGHLDGTLSVDASQASPPVHLHLHAPGLALKPLLLALRQPPVATGNVELYADVEGAGLSPHAIASSLDGSVGIAIPGGSIDNRIVGSILGRVMNDINALDLVGRGGSSELRCFGVRLDAKQGTVAIDALTLSSALITLTGGGSANLGNETMDLLLKPEVRIGGASLVIPVRIAGPMRNPATKVDRVSSAEANIDSIAGALTGRKNPLGELGGLLGIDKPGGDSCASALAAARGQAVAPKAPALSDPGTVLRRLFR